MTLLRLAGSTGAPCSWAAIFVLAGLSAPTGLLAAGRPIGPLQRSVPVPADRSIETRLGGPLGKHSGALAAATTSTISPNAIDAAAGPSRLEKLRQRLDELLAEAPLSKTHMGMVVLDARDGAVLFQRNSDRPFNPASNTKILTTAAALRRLGGDFRYSTRLHGASPDESGVVHGNVELRGSGDPSLTTAGLADLARALAGRGISRLEGDLLADGKFRDSGQPAITQGGGALVFNRNCYTIHVRPTTNKNPASLSLDPPSPEYVTVVNQVTTVRKRKTRLRVTGERKADRLIITIKGRINPQGDERLKYHLGDGAMHAATVLRRQLADFGVTLTGKLRSGGLPGDAPMLAEHKSAPLSDICRVSNKESNNFVADAIFKTLGREVYGAPGTVEKGVRAVEEIMPELGLAADAYKVVNGSGLSHENRISPDALAKLLRSLYFDLSVSPEFISSLAVGGIDGTIKSRFRGDDIGRVRAKTGTLANVSALSGYAGAGGNVLIFAILVDDFNHRKLEEVRYAQNRLVREMLAYLRAGQPAHALPGVGPADETPGDDEPGGDDEDDDALGNEPDDAIDSTDDPGVSLN